MLHTLQINKDGMKSLSFFDSGMLRWMRTSDLEVVTSYKGEIGAFDGKNLDIESDKDKVRNYTQNYLFSMIVRVRVVLIYKDRLLLVTDISTTWPEA